MRSSFRAVALVLAVALLCVPAAFAKGPGGHGGGKPSWAGSGGNGHGGGKPPWAGQGQGHDKAHPDTAKAKHEKKHQRAETDAEEGEGDEELDLADLNPAWQCFMVEQIMDEQDAETEADGAEAGELSSFDEEFGTNDNKQNSHGMCVSAAANGDDVSAALEEDEEQECEATEEEDAEEASEDDSEEASDEGEAAEDETEAAEDETEAAEDETEASDDETEASGDEAEALDECEQDDGSADDGAEAGDDEGEDSGEEAGDDTAGDEPETAAFAQALVAFVRL